MRRLGEEILNPRGKAKSLEHAESRCHPERSRGAARNTVRRWFDFALCASLTMTQRGVRLVMVMLRLRGAEARDGLDEVVGEWNADAGDFVVTCRCGSTRYRG